MINNIINIEEKIIALGKSITLKENHEISIQGAICQYIVFLPNKTKLNINNRIIDINEGIYLNVKEFFNKESLRHTITTTHKTKAILLDSESLEKKTDVIHHLRLFFLKKMSQQASLFQTEFE